VKDSLSCLGIGDRHAEVRAVVGGLVTAPRWRASRKRAHLAHSKACFVARR
jgi:hypothetical protein